jgi:hypothetical protein
MKPKYEKPTAVPLGEAVKGSGQCITGSGVGPIAGTSLDWCLPGVSGYGCNSGDGGPYLGCITGDSNQGTFVKCVFGTELH